MILFIVFYLPLVAMFSYSAMRVAQPHEPIGERVRWYIGIGFLTLLLLFTGAGAAFLLYRAGF